MANVTSANNRNIIGWEIMNEPEWALNNNPYTGQNPTMTEPVDVAQHQRCPAMRACALALTGSDAIDPVLNAANGFADALQDADQRLSPEGVAALMAGRRRGSPDRRAPV